MTAPRPETVEQVDIEDLALLLRRFIQLTRDIPDEGLATLRCQALNYLQRKRLLGSTLGRDA